MLVAASTIPKELKSPSRIDRRNACWRDPLMVRIAGGIARLDGVDQFGGCGTGIQ